MDKERATYTKTVPDNLVQIVGGMKYAGVAMLAIRLNAFADGDEARVSIPTLCDIFSCSVNTIKEYARRLSMLDIWHMTTIHGRGNVAVWKKGSNFDTYTSLKPSNFDGFTTTENHQTLTEKPSNFDGYNIDNNKEVENAHASARTSDPSSLEVKQKVTQGDTPCTPQINTSMKYPFTKFWEEYKVHPYYQHEEAACEGMWSVMSDLLREDILKTIKARKPKEKNPYFFLYYYKPTSLRLAAIGTIVSHDDYYKFYGHDMPVDGWVFEKPEGYERFMFVKKGFAQ